MKAKVRVHVSLPSLSRLLEYHNLKILGKPGAARMRIGSWEALAETDRFDMLLHGVIITRKVLGYWLVIANRRSRFGAKHSVRCKPRK